MTDSLIKKPVVLQICFIILFFMRLICGDHFFEGVDDLEYQISPEDLEYLSTVENLQPNATGPFNGDSHWFWPPEDGDDDQSSDELTSSTPAAEVDCFGVGSFASKLRWLFNLRPMSSQQVDVNYYFYSRKQRIRTQVHPGNQFGLEWVDFDPNRPTVMIIHGFMSHSNASWVRNLTEAYLDWADVNVITVDWSRGGNTWKYWRAVANTRRVGTDVTSFLNQLKNRTGCSTSDFHLIGHSLGAHICSYIATHLGGFKRITGLDPAQLCFRTNNEKMLLDKTDAEFVDIIHTNGRMLSRLGFGMPDPSGHADFYPNGGMKQPGCYNSSRTFLYRLMPISPKKLKQAICSHGRAHALFTESLRNKNCSFIGHRWNLTLAGITESLNPNNSKKDWAEMGINAIGNVAEGIPRAAGAYFVLTAESRPYCLPEDSNRSVNSTLIHDLRHHKVFHVVPESVTPSTYYEPYTPPYSDVDVTTTTKKPKKWWKFWIFWFVILTVSGFCLFWLTDTTLKAMEGSPVSFTPNTLFLDWKTTFPSVTVCESYQSLYTANLIRENYPDIINVSDFTMLRYMSDIMFAGGTCKACGSCGDVIPCDVNFRAMADKVKRSCKELVNNCSFISEPFECCDFFLPIDTERGTCYSFNTLQSRLKATKFTLDLKSGPGILFFDALANVDVYVLGIEEIPTTVISKEQIFNVIKPGTTIEFVFSIVEVENTPEIAEVDIETRGCRFFDEQMSNFTLASFPGFSFTACVISCKTHIRFNSCNCIHFVRALDYESKFCNFTGISCLTNFEDMERQQSVLSSDICGESCTPSCLESEITRIALQSYPNHSNERKVVVRMLNLPTMRYSRNLLRTPLDFVVSLGGLIGLCFGASLLSIVEIIFLLVFR